MVGTRAGGKSWVALVAILAAALLAGALAAGPAQATVPAKKCGKIEVGRKDFKIRAHLIGCDRARKASRKFARSGKHGKSWDCNRYPPSVTKIAFKCDKGRKDYIAIRA
jgi:hypothetical protein